ncbi:hypothetical protein [Siccirubricoccus phaeus]|nr:hypothetical protein [Siccirubricoccus phaeus]
MIDIIGCWRLVRTRATGADGAPIADHQYGPEPADAVDAVLQREDAPA